MGADPVQRGGLPSRPDEDDFDLWSSERWVDVWRGAAMQEPTSGSVAGKIREAIAPSSSVDFPKLTEICERGEAEPSEVPEAVALLVGTLKDQHVPFRKKLKALTVANEMTYDARAVSSFRDTPGLLEALRKLRETRGTVLGTQGDENIRMLATEVEKNCFGNEPPQREQGARRRWLLQGAAGLTNAIGSEVARTTRATVELLPFGGRGVEDSRSAVGNFAEIVDSMRPPPGNARDGTAVAPGSGVEQQQPVPPPPPTASGAGSSIVPPIPPSGPAVASTAAASPTQVGVPSPGPPPAPQAGFGVPPASSSPFGVSPPPPPPPAPPPSGSGMATAPQAPFGLPPPAPPGPGIVATPAAPASAWPPAPPGPPSAPALAASTPFGMTQQTLNVPSAPGYPQPPAAPPASPFPGFESASAPWEMGSESHGAAPDTAGLF